MAGLTWIARIIFGVTFIFSGFVKAIDPWGTIYKFEEYFSALGIPLLHSIVVLAAFGLFTIEFLIGIFFLFGCYRRSNPWFGLAFMCVMLPLTLWIAIMNPVADCGCFGDAITLSNWATFWKNVVLTLIALWLVKFNLRAIPLVSPAFQWIAAVVSVVFTLVISVYGYKIQPLVDFRPYPIGTTIPAEEDPEAESSFLFVYEKDGERIQVSEDDDLPDENDGWHFVERIENQPTVSVTTESRTFRVWNSESDEDISEELLSSGQIMLLLMPDLGSISPAATWKINQLYENNKKAGIQTIGVVDASKEVIAAWSDLSMPQYPIYTADDTAIKEVARGNPAAVYLSDGVIEYKAVMNSVDIDDNSGENISQISEKYRGRKNPLLFFTLIYFAIMMILVGASFLPTIRKSFKYTH